MPNKGANPGDLERDFRAFVRRHGLPPAEINVKVLRYTGRQLAPEPAAIAEEIRARLAPSPARRRP